MQIQLNMTDSTAIFHSNYCQKWKYSSLFASKFSNDYGEKDLTHNINNGIKSLNINSNENAFILSELKNEIKDLRMMVEEISNNCVALKNENIYLKATIDNVNNDFTNYKNLHSQVLYEVTEYFIENINKSEQKLITVGMEKDIIQSRLDSLCDSINLNSTNNISNESI